MRPILLKRTSSSSSAKRLSQPCALFTIQEVCEDGSVDLELGHFDHKPALARRHSSRRAPQSTTLVKHPRQLLLSCVLLLFVCICALYVLDRGTFEALRSRLDCSHLLLGNGLPTAAPLVDAGAFLDSSKAP